MLNHKKLKLLYILNEDIDMYYSAEEIAQKLNISLRTAYRYIKDINELSHDKEPLIKSKQGVGFKLNESSRLVNDIINKSTIRNYEYNEEVKLLSKLFFSRRKYRVNDLEFKLFMSKPSVYRMLYRVNETIKQFNVKFIFDNNFLSLEGKTNNVRNWMLKVCIEDADIIDVLDPYSFFEKLQNQINSSFFQYGLTEQDMYMMTTGIIVSLFINKKDFIKKNLIENEDLVKSFVISYELEKGDYYFLKKMFYNFRYFNEISFKDKIDNTIKYSLQTILRDPIQKNQYENYELVDRLSYHILELLKRSYYKISSTNPFLNEIQLKYPLEYNLAGHICFQLGSEIGLEFTKDEIAYIALYLVTLSRKAISNTMTLNTIIVCDQGLSMGYYIAEEVNQHCTKINIKAIIQKENIKNFYDKSIDFIISTTEINTDINIPIIVVSRLFDLQTYKKINSLVSDIEVNNTKISKYFCDIVIELKSESFEDCLFEMLNSIFSKDKSEILQKKLLEREKLAPTATGKNAAFPHAVIEGDSDTIIIVGVSEEGVLWDGEIIFVIFATIISEKEIKDINIFKGLYKFIQNEKLLNNLIKRRNIEELVEFLGGKINGNY